ncbi:MAG: CAAX protease [Flavobacterium sp. BFFFF2]|nr:MAG: CAAX protease [Flavobacterium sp. BFFFF2]
MEYNKPPFTYLEQLNLMKSRGLHVADDNRAIRYLTNISYYRLSAYALPFQKVKDTFDVGTDFQDILHLYQFDRELRLLVFNAIERIEVAVRARMIYILAHKYGAHWQDNAKIYKDPYRVKNNRTGEYHTIDVYSEVQEMIGVSTKDKHPETFIKHYKNTYHKPINPPSWMCLEVLTLGQLSKLFNGLKENGDKQLIAAEFGLHYTVFKSWLHTLTYVRNICGHHGRLWNREIAIAPLWLEKPKKPWINKRFNEVPNRSFYTICLIKYILQTVNPSHHIKEHLKDLIAKYPTVPIAYMGIPSNEDGSMFNWENEPLWK